MKISVLKTHTRLYKFCKFLGVYILAIYCSITNAQLISPDIDLDGNATLEDVSNVYGGEKTGSVLNGVAYLTATYKQNFKIGLVGATHTQNQSLYTGSIQNTTSLSVQREVRLAELSYKRQLNHYLAIKLGIMDLEEYYDITAAADCLLNAAFSNTMTLAQNTQLASFPYSGIGAMLELRSTDNYGLLGIYQGNPQHLHTVFYHGYMLISEAGTNIRIKIARQTEQQLSLKAGLWLYQANGTPDYTNARGAYLIAQIDYATNNHHIAPFLQAAYSNETPKTIPYALTAGIKVDNICLHDNTDALSFGIGKVWLNHVPSEIVYELAYAIKLYDKFSITPDLQYFVKPSGIYPNATVLALRLSYDF